MCKSLVVCEQKIEFFVSSSIDAATTQQSERWRGRDGEGERWREGEVERLEQLHWKLNTCHVYSANRAKHFMHSSFLFCPAGGGAHATPSRHADNYGGTQCK